MQTKTNIKANDESRKKKSEQQYTAIAGLAYVRIIYDSQGLLLDLDIMEIDYLSGSVVYICPCGWWRSSLLL